MTSEDLVLNPLSGRYCRKYGTIWKRLVEQGTIEGLAEIPAISGKKAAPTIDKRIDSHLLNQTATIASEQKDKLKGLSRAEADELLSQFLYERLIMQKPTTARKTGATAQLGQPKGLTRSIVLPVKKYGAAALSSRPETSSTFRHKPMFIGRKSDADDETDFSVGTSQIEETEDSSYD